MLSEENRKKLLELSEELKAEGVINIRFSWNEDTIANATEDDLAAEVIAALQDRNCRFKSHNKPLEEIGGDSLVGEKAF